MCVGGEGGVFRTFSSPEAAIDDEKDGDKEGGHLAGVNQGVGPAEERRGNVRLQRKIRIT